MKTGSWTQKSISITVMAALMLFDLYFRHSRGFKEALMAGKKPALYKQGLSWQIKKPPLQTRTFIAATS